jgi:(1->4)-alpha-D-glucan 1-alpha-D-glucosylmutase
MERFLCIHGHFCQPPRESPWLEVIELEDSAYPYHDWHERITAECYAPNAVARILDGAGRIERLVNNYARISFNFAPTLLAWLQDKAPDVYAGILDADREGQKRFSGHGPALAQAYNHAILPLAGRADKVTSVVWGTRDFEHRFGRAPEGMWLPETAVDLETLEVLAEHGIRFTVLAPSQAGRVRPLGSGDADWQDIRGGHIDTTQPFLQRLPSGRSIALFFFDDAIAREVAFGRLLDSGAALAARLLGAFKGGPDVDGARQLVHIATDGECYGHHHTHGDMALAYALQHLEATGQARLTNYGELLERFPPRLEVEALERTSWSCRHGVERWRADCGCHSGRAAGNQAWRAPLRAAIDALRDAVAGPFEEHGQALFRDPAAARNDYVAVVLDRSPDVLADFLARHARRELDDAERVRAVKLLELQRHALLMYASSGWHFDDISSPETVQVLLYAGRAVQLGEGLFGLDLEGPFLQRLEQAPGNVPEQGNGRQVYEQYVRAARVDGDKIGAHYAISSLFEAYPAQARVSCYRVDREDSRTLEAGKVKLVLGHAGITSVVTQERQRRTYAAIHFGDHNVQAGVRPFQGEEAYRAAVAELEAAFARVDYAEIIRVMDRHFGASYSLASLFRDEQRRVLKRVLRAGLADTTAAFARLFEQNLPLMRFLKHLGAPLPYAFQGTADILFNTDLRWAFADDDPNFEGIRSLLREARAWQVPLDTRGLAYKFSRLLGRTAERWREQPAQPELLVTLNDGVDLARSLPFEPSLWKVQNVYFELMRGTFPAQAELAQDGDEAARQWVERFLLLGEKLGVQTEELKKKLAELGRRVAPADLVHELIATRWVPSATYRLQFNKDFPFPRATALVDYLHDLGIGDLYASPILQARPDSPHGYDICDHSRVNPELGGEAALDELAAALKARGMGLLVDTVPNHMGVNHPSNRWWMDVLENGASSRYAAYFDIAWRPVNPDLENKVLLPVLGDQYGQVLEGGQLRVDYQDGAFNLNYYDLRLPLAPRTYGELLRARLDALAKALGEAHEHVQELRSIRTAVAHLPPPEGLPPQQIAERDRENGIIKRRLAALMQASPEVRGAIEAAVQLLNGRAGSPSSFDALDALIEAQSFRPAYWRVAMEEINYRRFFDVNELAAIRPELPEVFLATHQVLLRLLAEGKVTGLRIDHPDGMWSPAGYFRQLQESYVRDQVRQRGRAPRSAKQLARAVSAALDETAAAQAGPFLAWPLYVVAEKILSEGEPLPADWAVDGTSGYDFLNEVNGLFVDGRNAGELDRIYRDFTARPTDLKELVLSCKEMIMEGPMASEIISLSHQLDRLAEGNRRYRDFTLGNLTLAVRAIIACLPIYRTYTRPGEPVSPRDRQFIEQTVEEAKARDPRTAEAVFDFLRDTLLWRNLEQFREADRPHVVEWVMRFQQLTGPIMAKGVEDTAFYVYNRLVSLNEVGGHPEHFGLSVEELHRLNAARFERWPHSLLATSTHDTKRSEDVRARLNVLSEMPGEWERAVRRWRELHAGLVAPGEAGPMPAPNDQYLFYQTVVGAWPPGEMTPEGLADFRGRLAAYMLKAIKEAKVYTSWVNPEEAYDGAVRSFVLGALADGPDNVFLREADEFQRRIAFFGYINSLSQVVLKCTCPGVPDVYQGCELWDFSLVDPDNRRPVDHDLRRRLLAELREQVGRAGDDLRPLATGLLKTVEDGRIKLYLTFRTLELRRRRPGLFARGAYVPLPAEGQKAGHVCAFAREAEGARLLTAVPVRVAGLPGGDARPPGGAEAWGDTRLAVGGEAGARYRNVYTGEVVGVEGGGLWLREVMGTLPWAVLERMSESSNDQ